MVDADTVISWSHIQMNKVRPSTHSESQLFNSWLQPEVDIVHPLILFGTQVVRSWAHPGTDIITYFASTKFDKVRTWIQPVIEIRTDIHYKTHRVTSASSEVEPNGATLLTSNFGSWSKRLPFLPVETVPFPCKYFTSLSTESYNRKPRANQFSPSK